jgi:hypothetical protein
VDALKDEAAKNRQLAFLGIVTQAKSFVILIDMSGSMEDYDQLMARTVSELLGQTGRGGALAIRRQFGSVPGCMVVMSAICSSRARLWDWWDCDGFMKTTMSRY